MTPNTWHGHYPEPMDKAPEVGTVVWVVDTANPKSDHFVWWTGFCDALLLQRGRLHPTREAAEAHARFEIELAGGQA
ncbi:hypothetical protein [uncultured Rhodoferax sp.]|uniref:hypothetical protein n=1 Tax=uncultured Rhodoferax sp. TaxID=223188 RepID=UPI0025DD819F|nr:hypothetical protein [uncultured Rhodoferax sp.]